MTNTAIKYDSAWDYSDTAPTFDERLTFDLYDDAYKEWRQEFLRVWYEILAEMKEILDKWTNLWEWNIDYIKQEISNLKDDLSETISETWFKNMGERI